MMVPTQGGRGGQYQAAKFIDMKRHAQFNERWLQERIAEDPSLLGLGADFVLKYSERPQPHAGRLDLLLSDVDRALGTRSRFS